MFGLAMLSASALLAQEVQRSSTEGNKQFSDVDKNGDGRLSREEIQNQALFERMDANSNGWVTLADVLKKAGYATGMFGKWHLGSRPHLHPQARGFDEFYGFLAGAHSFFPAKDAEPVFSTVMRGRDPLIEPEYLTDAIARETVSNGPNVAVRKTNWKLVESYDNVWLFDLSEDLGEENNLAKTNPDIVAQLEEDLQQWKSQMTAPAWPSKPQRRKVLIDGMTYEQNI